MTPSVILAQNGPMAQPALTLPSELKALTDKEEAFVVAYMSERSPMRAYRLTYAGADAGDDTCRVEGQQVVARPHVAARINQLTDAARAASANPVIFDTARALELFLAIAEADPDELIGLRIGACRYCHGADHQYHWRVHEYLDEVAKWEKLEPSIKLKTGLPSPGGGLDFNHTKLPHPDCPECHGEGVERVIARDTSKLSKGAKLLFGGVKKKKDGLEIVIADRAKALENAARIVGAFAKDAPAGGGGSGTQIAQMIAYVQINAGDPTAAAKAYQEMIAYSQRG